MGRLIFRPFRQLPELFRLHGTAKSIGATGLFRSSGKNKPSAHVHARLFFYSLLINNCVNACTYIYRRNAGTDQYSCGFRLFRVAGTVPACAGTGMNTGFQGD